MTNSNKVSILFCICLCLALIIHRVYSKEKEICQNREKYADKKFTAEWIGKKSRSDGLWFIPKLSDTTYWVWGPAILGHNVTKSPERAKYDFLPMAIYKSKVNVTLSANSTERIFTCEMQNNNFAIYNCITEDLPSDDLAFEKNHNIVVTKAGDSFYILVLCWPVSGKQSWAALSNKKSINSRDKRTIQRHTRNDLGFRQRIHQFEFKSSNFGIG